MSSGRLVVLVPVLGRPHRVEPLLASIAAATSVSYRVVFIASIGDQAEIAAIDRAGAPMIEMEGNYAEKINAGIEATDEPLLFIGADDLEFHPGWFEDAETRIAAGYRVVGTQDLCNPRVIAGEHATHFLVARSYVDEYGTIDEPGKLLHEGYRHEYTDDELIGTAKLRGEWAFADESIVEHLHPLVGKAPIDDLYAGISERMRRDRSLARRRRRLWEPASR